MKPIKYIALTLAAISTLAACQKDPLEEVNDGDWNKERNIIGITFNGQVGEPTITRNGDVATIGFTYNTSLSADFSAIAVTALEISYGAKASVAVGDALNFENETNSATVTVTPVHGKPLTWKITLTPFTETLLGTWNITGLSVYGGTGAVYGGSSVVEMTEKSWCWNSSNGPAAEKNNTLTFTLEGIDEDGNSFVKVVNNAGSDGLYADFIYIHSDPDVNVNSFYRKIPTGESSWLRNYSAGTVTFTFANGTTTTGSFVGAGTETLYGSITKTVIDHAFTFTLKGADDWTNIYTDYDRFVSNPQKYWIEIAKSK